MRRAAAVIALVAATLAACAQSEPPAATAQAQPAAQAKVDQLHAQAFPQGTFLVDPAGRVVLTHGVNAVWKRPPYYPPDTAAGFTAADADWLHDHGFNTARVGILFAGVMPQPGVVDPTYFAHWQRVIDLMASRGVYVLLDFHQDMYNERYAGEGFPDWATNDDGIPMPASLGFPGNYFTPACTRAFDNFWNDTGSLWDSYRDAWTAVAARWRNQDHVMGYDLMNEPWPGSDVYTCMNPAGCPAFDTLKLQAMQEHARGGIRSVDPANVVWFEPNVIFNEGAKSNLGLVNPVDDGALGFSWHKYCLPATLVHAQGINDVQGCEQLHALVSGNAREAVARLHAASLITEFGASDDLADLKQVTSQADADFVGWQYWQYKEWADPTTESQTSGGQGLFRDDSDLSSIKVEKLKILERTYPQATAGVPASLSFDPDTGDFDYRYVAQPARAPTVIYVPVALHYPAGYVAQATGGRITSPPGAHWLVVENDPGATNVEVVVRAVAP